MWPLAMIWQSLPSFAPGSTHASSPMMVRGPMTAPTSTTAFLPITASSCTSAPGPICASAPSWVLGWTIAVGSIRALSACFPAAAGCCGCAPWPSAWRCSAPVALGVSGVAELLALLGTFWRSPIRLPFSNTACASIWVFFLIWQRSPITAPAPIHAPRWPHMAGSILQSAPITARGRTTIPSPSCEPVPTRERSPIAALLPIAA